MNASNGQRSGEDEDDDEDVYTVERMCSKARLPLRDVNVEKHLAAMFQEKMQLA